VVGGEMIYGLNFNGTPIPPGYKRKFAERRKFTVGTSERVTGKLDGVAENLEEAIIACRVADNGTRRVTYFERHGLYGIYTY
jgi:hypothetical protein